MASHKDMENIVVARKRNLNLLDGFAHPDQVCLCERVQLIDGVERDKVILLIKVQS